MTVDIAPPARTGTVRLADDRKLAWSEWGSPDGVPVLLFPGAATTGSLGFGASAVSALGVRLIAVVSPADEVADPRFAAALPEQLRDTIALAASNPVAAEQVFATFDADAMWQMVIDTSPAADLAIYRDPVFEAAYRRALRDAFAPGPAGYARDTVLAMGRWPFDVSTIGTPVDVWFGEQDTSHSPDLGAGLTAGISGARRHIVPGIGGAVLWTHADDVLRTLLGHVR